jgi:TonB family protein
MFTNALAAVATGIQQLYLILAGAVVVVMLFAMVLRVKKTRRKGGAPARVTETRATGKPFSGVLLSSRPEHDARGAARLTAWSVIVHVCVIGGLVWATTKSIEAEAENGLILVLPPDEPPLSPPPPPLTPIQVAPSSGEIDGGFPILIVPDIVLPDIPPPWEGANIPEAIDTAVGRVGSRGDGREGAPQSDLFLAPQYIRHTIRPDLKNAAEVQRVLMRTYPPLLRDSGIGGSVLLWFLIDETGKVVKTQLKESSGHAQLDEAAARVAEIMVFSPAINGDRKVTVWVAIPMLFTAR